MIKTGFNILTEPWIKVEMGDGSMKMVGAMEALKNAQCIKRLAITSATQEFGVYRFLTAFLLDAIRPNDSMDEYFDMLDKGCFDAEKLDSYVHMCEQEGVSFDLFDKDNPFMQCKPDDLDGTHVDSVRMLDDSVSTGNNHAIFDHPRTSVKRFSPVRTFLTMLARLTFTNNNGVGYSIGIHGMLPYFTIVSGENLFETLLVCLMAANNSDLVKKASCGFDAHPVLWRRSEPIVSKGLVSEVSWMETFFFPSRKICLIQDEDGYVSKIHYGPGMKYTQVWRADPFVNYCQMADGMLVSIRPDKYDAAWKSLEYLTGTLCAAVIHAAYELFDDKKALDVTLYGLETKQAAIIIEKKFDLSLPVVLLDNETANNAIKNFLSFAGMLTNDLKSTVKKLKILGKGGSAFETAGFGERLNTVCERELFSLCDEVGDGITNESIEFHETAAMKACAKIYREMFLQASIRPSMLGVAEDKLGFVLRKARKQIKKLNATADNNKKTTNDKEDDT